MANITPTRQVPDSLNHQVLLCTYANMQSGDVGVEVEAAQFADRTVQVVGTFGVGGNVRVEGSLDGVNYAVLTDPQGNALDINTAKVECITELVRYIRPRVTAGDGTTSLSVILLIKGK